MADSVHKTSIADNYPPEEHFLRDLNITLQIQESRRATIHAPVCEEVCNDQGSMYVGIIGTLADVVGGIIALQAVSPFWVATSSISIHTVSPAESGMLTVTGSPIKVGREMVLIEIKIFQSMEHQNLETVPIGSALVTSTRLSRKKENFHFENNGNRTVTIDLSSGPSGLAQPLEELLGVRVLDPAAGSVEMDMSDYIRNSLYTLHGGMFAILTDIAGQHTARQVTGKPLITSDLEIHYIEWGKRGPFRTKASVLSKSRDTCLSRIELIDRGAKNRLLAVAINRSSILHPAQPEIHPPL